jgi:hypothetical protein
LLLPAWQLRISRNAARQDCPAVPAVDPPSQHPEEFDMSKRIWVVAAVAASFAAGIAYAQFPIMDKVADKVVQKYQTATCEQLWAERAQGKGQPKPEMEQRAISALKSDPQMRQAFFNKVSAPIVNKMFECGMIP